MNDRLNSELPAGALPAIPAHWAEDPTAQLRELKDEVIRQMDFPATQSRDFMVAARSALEQLPAEHSSPERVEALMCISRFHYLDADTELTIDCAAAAVKAAVLGGHRKLEGQARTKLAIGLRGSYDFFGSINEFGRALEITREVGDPAWEAKVLNSLGNSYSDAGLQSEALAIFEQVATFFEENNDPQSVWMALDNGALAALRQGDIGRGRLLASKAGAAWCGEPQTANEHLWVVQGALVNCLLLIELDRTEEAVAWARRARLVADSSGMTQADTLAEICETITSFLTGAVGTDAIERMIARASGESPNQHWDALDAAIRTYERAGQVDRALALQHELLALNRAQKFEAVRRTMGRPSPEEAMSAGKLANLGTAVDRKITDLVNAAITQALRVGYDHARIFRVSRLAELFATTEGWPPVRIQNLALSAKLIDLGMMVIADDLARKPRQWSEGERRLVAAHAQFGAELLTNVRLALLEPCVPTVRFHHERWDGSGPCGLKAQGIPDAARVVALCDSWDALTHVRPWRPAIPADVALRMIGEGAGTQFDPDLSARFVEFLRRELRKSVDFDAYLAVDALENEYVRTRTRIDQLIRRGVS
jgi:putative two-component system response regulator